MSLRLPILIGLCTIMLAACTSTAPQPSQTTPASPSATTAPSESSTASPSATTPDANAGASDKDATPSASAPSTKPYDGPKMPQLKVYIPQTLGLSAPLMNFGKMGHLDNYVESTAVENWNTITTLTGLWSRDELDIAATPSFTASNLYNKGVDARMVASVIWGFLYLIGPEDAIEGDFAQLKGKKIGLMRPGNMPDLAMQLLLKEHGMTRDDVEFIPVEEPSMIVPMIVKGEIDWAVGMEHQMSLAIAKAKEKGRNLKTVLDLQKEWKKSFGKDGFPTLSIVMPQRVLDQYPGIEQAVIKELQATSAKVVDLDPETISQLATQYKLKEDFIKHVIPRLNIRVEPAKDIQQDYEEFLERLGTVSTKIYGGKIPDDDFYAGSLDE